MCRIGQSWCRERPVQRHRGVSARPCRNGRGNVRRAEEKEGSAESTGLDVKGLMPGSCSKGMEMGWEQGCKRGRKGPITGAPSRW